MKKGFTLAEVLITLAIIGVVAALTIPTVVQNYRKTQTVTQLKKTYSALANTTNLAIANEGPVQDWEVVQSEEGSKNFFNKYLVPYLKVAKNCENETTGVCQFRYRYLNETTTRTMGASRPRIILSDGTLVSGTTFNYEDTGWKGAIIQIDINGQKTPNTFGKDIFEFYYNIQNGVGKLIPSAGLSSRNNVLSSETYGCNKNASGSFCAALIMFDGWQIKDDYPWN
jgi:prepilin-type N-terminal cleavage/methylation domain-containing protein